MDEGRRLQNEITKVRDAYVGLEAEYNMCNVEFSAIKNDNRSHHHDNQKLNEELHNLKHSVDKVEEENQILENTNRDLNNDLEKMKNGTVEHRQLQANVLTLEEQLRQLQNELVDAKTRKAQYLDENSLLNHCLVNARNEVEEKVNTIRELNEQLPKATNEINSLSCKVIQLTEELQVYQDPNALSRATERHATLTAEKNRLTRDLIDALELNEKLQPQVIENERIIQAVQNDLRNSTKTIEQLEAVKAERIEKFDQLETKVMEVKRNVKETTENNSTVSHENSHLEADIKTLQCVFDFQSKSYRTKTEELLGVLKQNKQLENELEAKISTKQNSDAVEDLKLTLRECIVTTTEALEAFNNVPADFTELKLEDDSKNEQCISQEKGYFFANSNTI